ncbi:MAG: F420-dependent methylenetetrahydromethanopterin dehydrogenase, partial [Candidatus Bathyarchaeia archaeon]
TAELVVSQSPDIVILIGPAQSAPGPREARRMLAEAGIPTVVISDRPTKKIVNELERDGFGYIIVNGDSMIGARREFLDPTEMALYNANIIKVLATTGAFKVIVKAVDGLIQAVKSGEKPTPPHTIIDKETAVTAADFDNPYARSKAMAAYEIACKVADLTVEGCFVIKDWKRYIRIVAAAHEMMRHAAKLCDEAVEMEKGRDAVSRSPHHPDGTLLFKRRLIEKPSQAEE